jgi:NAD(P)-dependent dehydrogenase (short-subunit alcohol dehydrogenase family)
MATPFEGKTLIITGASEGIGRALALALAGQRARLALAARGADRLAELAEACEARGAEAITVTCDVTSEADCQRLVDETVARFGGLDALVANAGRTMWSEFEALEDLRVIEQVMAVNYFGAVYGIRAALPHLRRSGGRLVAIASVAGLTGVPARSGYCASKHALIGFCDSLRIELADSGVSVTVVAPDFVVSEIHRRALGSDGRPLGQSPMQEDKIMTAERCAELIVEAMAERRRMLVTSARGRLGRWLKLIAPALIDRIARRAIEERR